MTTRWWLQSSFALSNELSFDSFQKGDAKRHTAHANLKILHEWFEGIVISRGGDVNWGDVNSLTPLDFL